MITMYDRLLELNQLRKQQYKEYYEKVDSRLKASMRTSCVYTIKKLFGNYFIKCKQSDSMKILDIGQLYYLLQRDYVHITNLSLISNVTRIIDNCLLNSSDWMVIKEILNNLSQKRKLNSLSIIKVDDMNNYIAKTVLIGKCKVLLSKPCYSLVINNKGDVVLMSELKLVVNDETQFRLDALGAKIIKIENIDIANEHLGVVTDLSNLFRSCVTEKIVLENFNTSKVIDFKNMFYSCVNLKEINTEILNTSSGACFEFMFGSCSSLEILDLRSFDVSKAVNLTNMFSNCNNLREIKLDTWLFKNIERINCQYMFMFCKNLTLLKIEVFSELLKRSPAYKTTMFRGTPFETIV